MVRRADDSFLRGDGGGPVPRHDEQEIDGPFVGFQTDSDPRHRSPPQLARDIENLDILTGNLTLRPGTRELLDPDDFASDVPTPNTFKRDTPCRLLDAVSEPSGDVSTSSQWAFFIWGNYNIWEPNFVNRFGDPPGVAPAFWLFENCQIGTFFDVSRGSLPASLVSTVAFSSTVTLTVGAGDWEFFRVIASSALNPKAYFKVSDDPASSWIQIVSATPTTLTLLTPYPATHTDEAYHIAIPIIDASDDINNGAPGSTINAAGTTLGTSATRLPLTDPAEYYITGWAGGVVFSLASTPIQSEPYQILSDPIRYVANDGIIYAGRLLIASDTSYDASLAAAPPDINDPAARVSHPGRIAWTRTNNIRSFDFSPATGGDPTAGFIDDIGVVIGRIYDLFEMRGVAYALSERGIAAINATGNAFDPFRIRVLVQGKLITPRSRAQVIDGKFAVFLTTDGVYLFDGASIEPVSIPISEYYRGEFGIKNTTEIVTSGSLYYDDIRNRAYIFTDNDANDFLVYDNDNQYWLKHNVSMQEGTGQTSKRFANGISWSKTAGLPSDDRQDIEMLVIGRGINVEEVDKLYSYERNLTQDDGEDFGWFWFSPTIDFQESRSDKTVVRFRMTVNDTDGLTAQPVTIEWFVDGGITPRVTKTFDIGTNAVAGEEVTKFVTFPGITATTFRFRLSGPSRKPVIKEMAVTLKRRLEDRQT